MNNSGAWLFVAVAIVLVGSFGASLYWAGARGGNGANGVPRGQSLWLMLAAPLAVVALYAMRGEPRALSQPSPDMARPSAMQIKAAIEHLAESLKEHPENLDGWLMLARSYTVVGRYADAAAAYEHAQTRVMQDSGLLVNWIELRLMLSNRQFDARTHELVERAAALAPDDPNVLLLRALAAFDRGDKTRTAALVHALREHYPPGTPDREALDAALEKLMPQQDAPAK